MDEQDTITVETTNVPCDGGGGPLGHPRVFLKLDPETNDATCPYCSRHYVLAADAKIAAGH